MSLVAWEGLLREWFSQRCHRGCCLCDLSISYLDDDVTSLTEDDPPEGKRADRFDPWHGHTVRRMHRFYDIPRISYETSPSTATLIKYTELDMAYLDRFGVFRPDNINRSWFVTSAYSLNRHVAWSWMPEILQRCTTRAVKPKVDPRDGCVSEKYHLPVTHVKIIRRDKEPKPRKVFHLGKSYHPDKLHVVNSGGSLVPLDSSIKVFPKKDQLFFKVTVQGKCYHPFVSRTERRTCFCATPEVRSPTATTLPAFRGQVRSVTLNFGKDTQIHHLRLRGRPLCVHTIYLSGVPLQYVRESRPRHLTKFSVQVRMHRSRQWIGLGEFTGPADRFSEIMIPIDMCVQFVRIMPLQWLGGAPDMDIRAYRSAPQKEEHEDWVAPDETVTYSLEQPSGRNYILWGPWWKEGRLKCTTSNRTHKKQPLLRAVKLSATESLDELHDSAESLCYSRSGTVLLISIENRPDECIQVSARLTDSLGYVLRNVAVESLQIDSRTCLEWRNLLVNDVIDSYLMIREREVVPPSPSVSLWSEWDFLADLPLPS